MNNEKQTSWDSADFLHDDKVAIEYLKAAIEECDAEFFVKAVGNVARARGMTSIARETQLGRQSPSHGSRAKGTK